MRTSTAVILLGMLFAVGCSSEPAAPAEPLEAPGLTTESNDEPEEPAADAAIFGTEDTVCGSVRLGNEDGDQDKAFGATTCLLAEIEAGRAVTVDIAAVTVDGDPIYTRYAFDGETTLIVEDNRADAFGSGSVRAIRCSEMRGSAWFPEGFDCQGDDHPGFPEAVG